jgi:hypothetical protein
MNPNHRAESVGETVGSSGQSMKAESVLPDLAYKKGDGIGGRYTVLDILGKGGFGVV